MDYEKLIAAAREVQRKAYAPYSHFAVGAAVLTQDNEIFIGCNVENVSLGLTICAERSAIAAAVANGQNHFVAIAIVTDSSEPALPCGACRQVLAEFGRETKVIAATADGKVQQFLLKELLPRPDQGLPKARSDV